MPKFKIEAKMIIRPYLTIEADTEEIAIQKIYDEEFDPDELIETSFPVSHIEIDNIYKEK